MTFKSGRGGKREGAGRKADPIRGKKIKKQLYLFQDEWDFLRLWSSWGEGVSAMIKKYREKK